MCHNTRGREEELFPVEDGWFTLFRKSGRKTEDTTTIYEADMLHFKLSLPRILAVSHFFVFQLNAHNMLNTHIYHQLHPTCSSVFMPPSGRPLHFLLKNCMLFAMLLHRLCYKM